MWDMLYFLKGTLLHKPTISKPHEQHEPGLHMLSDCTTIYSASAAVSLIKNNTYKAFSDFFFNALWGPLMKCRLFPRSTDHRVVWVSAVALTWHQYPKQRSCDGISCPNRLIYFISAEFYVCALKFGTNEFISEAFSRVQ